MESIESNSLEVKVSLGLVKFLNKIFIFYRRSTLVHTKNPQKMQIPTKQILCENGDRGKFY